MIMKDTYKFNLNLTKKKKAQFKFNIKVKTILKLSDYLQNAEKTI